MFLTFTIRQEELRNEMIGKSNSVCPPKPKLIDPFIRFQTDPESQWDVSGADYPLGAHKLLSDTWILLLRPNDYTRPPTLRCSIQMHGSNSSRSANNGLSSPPARSTNAYGNKKMHKLLALRVTRLQVGIIEEYWIGIYPTRSWGNRRIYRVK